MSERFVRVSYVEDFREEQELAEKLDKKIGELGGLALKQGLGFDEYYSGGMTPIVEFPSGAVIEGLSDVRELVETNWIKDEGLLVNGEN